jgi:hypothetical protein
LLFVITDVRSIAQQTADPKQAELAAYARLKTMTQAEFKELTAKALTGDSAAQYWVGCVYEEGRLVPKDSEEAARWFLKSAEQGFVPAQWAYGMMSVHINPSVGERWMLRAAEQGDAGTQFWLGFAYEENWFRTTDARLALKWYRKAAEGGDPDAQVVLGQRYAESEGVEQSYELAAKWFRKAAEHFPDLGGAGQGRNQLGLLYMEGRGVPQDYIQAYFWFSLNGHPDANVADAKVHLSPAQIRETDRLVEEWKEQHRVTPEVAAALHIEN